MKKMSEECDSNIDLKEIYLQSISQMDNGPNHRRYL